LVLRSVEVAGTFLDVRRAGAPDAIPFVFWHSISLGGNGSFIDVAAPALVAAGFAPVAPDAPGYARSAPLDAERYEVDHLAGFLWDVVDELELEPPLVLSGHSWGGSIAVTAAALRPDDVRALVLFDSGHVDYGDWPDARPEATLEELIAEIEADPLPDTWDDLVSLLAEHDLAQEWTLAAWREAFDVDADGALRRLGSTQALAAARIGLMRARASDAWPAIAAARIPTLVLLATEPEDLRERNAAAAEKMRRAVPKAELRPVNGMRHAVFADLGARAGELVADWLRERVRA
jgi:pimeloyl-ACP methyl ester carboxylesterase